MGIEGLDSLTNDIVSFFEHGVDEITDSVMIASKECASRCVENIRADSPSDSGDYKRGWVARKVKNGYVVYNRNKPNLEMILENGHIIARGKYRGMRVEGKPHIYKNADNARDEFYNLCVDIVSSGLRLKR